MRYCQMLSLAKAARRSISVTLPCSSSLYYSSVKATLLYLLFAIVSVAQLGNLTSRTIRQKLEEKFSVDLTNRKKEIDNILMAEIDDHANSHSEEEEVSEEEVHSSRKKADSDSDAEIEDGDEKDDDDEYQPSKGGRKPKAAKKRKGQDEDDDSDDDWSKKKPAKKGPAAGGRGGGGKKQSAFTKSFRLSPELADVVGSDVMPRHEVVKKLWAVIKERDLQDPKNKQYAICDDQLLKVFGIKRFRTFGMMKHLKDHFLEAA